MSAGYLYAANTASQALAVGDTINMGSPVRRFGCVKNTSVPYATVNGTTTTLSSCGHCPTYFDIEAAFVVTPTVDGTVTITALQDGVAIPGAVAAATVAAADTTVTLPLTFGVRLNTGTTSSNITYVLSGAASTVSNTAETVSKQ